MKAGLLICDHVDPAHQPRFGDYPNMFEQLFPDFQWQLYDAINGHFPKSLDDCQVYFATGSRHSAYEELEWIGRLKGVIRELYKRQKYFIGFCFGHQVLAEALGGRVEKSAGGWCVGVHGLEVYERKGWMQPFRPEMNLLMMCQDQVSRLPEGATLLAGNDRCPVGMFQFGNTMLGIQAHPEFSKEYDRLLMENRVERIGEDEVEEGVASLAKAVDRNMVMDWVVRFVRNAYH